MFSKLRRVFQRDLVQFMAPLPPGLLRRTGGDVYDLPIPFDDCAALYTFSGTAAIYQAARALGLRPGDRVLCPAYNCGHEIEPLLRYGVGVDYYAVDGALQVDLGDLESKIDRYTRAVLVTHYFGFPQRLRPLRDICDARRLYLIEDCAHALFSRGPGGQLGTEGDVAVFSIRKTVPLPNGGALVVNRPGISLPDDLPPPHWASTWSKTVELSRKWAFQCCSSPMLWPMRFLAAGLAAGPAGVRLLHRLGVFGDVTLMDPDNEDFNFDPAVLNWGMAPVAQRITRNVDPEEIVRHRRANFRVLLDGLRDAEGIRTLFHDIPEGVCPLFFPLLVYNRDRIVWMLNQKGVYAARWWEAFHDAVPWKEFPESVFLKDHVIALPVHQYLRDRHMQRMVDVLRDLSRPRRPAPHHHTSDGQV